MQALCHQPSGVGFEVWVNFLKVKVNVALPRTANEFTGAPAQLEKYFIQIEHFIAPPMKIMDAVKKLRGEAANQ